MKILLILAVILGFALLAVGIAAALYLIVKAFDYKFSNSEQENE